MITTKKELKEYLEADRIALERLTKRPSFCDLIWKYKILLRKTEYFTNMSKVNAECVAKRRLYSIISKLYNYRLFKIALKCGYVINLNSCGKGLSLTHMGPIIINGKLGDWCRVHVGVNIGVKAGTSDQKPIIGDHVYIGPGAKIFGAITIADYVAIGANSVVNKDILEERVSVGGIPAKVISSNGSEGLIKYKNIGTD